MTSQPENGGLTIEDIAALQAAAEKNGSNTVFVFDPPSEAQAEDATNLIETRLPEPEAQVTQAGINLAFAFLESLLEAVNPTKPPAQKQKKVFFRRQNNIPLTAPKYKSQTILGPQQLFIRMQAEITEVLQEGFTKGTVTLEQLQRYKVALITAHLIGQNGLQNRQPGNPNDIAEIQIYTNWNSSRLTLGSILRAQYAHLVDVIQT